MFNGAISGWNFFVLFEIGIVFLVITYKLRKRFPARVNCWFCNANASVPYLLRNSWTCEKCDQYNGFSPDGGYNRDVPAQYCTKLNWSPVRGRKGRYAKSSITSVGGLPPSNGLCETCNRNQSLKIQQLASFIPQSERTFDEEVELYQKHLDEVYALCRDCEGVVRRQLTRVKRRILGLKLTKAALILASKTSAVSSLRDKNSAKTFHNIVAYAAIGLGGLNFIRTCQNVRISEFMPALELPPFLSDHAETFSLYASATIDILRAVVHYLVSCLPVGLFMNIFTTALTPFYAIFNPTNAPDGDLALGDFFAEISIVQLLGVTLSLWFLWQSDSGNQNRAILMFLTWSASMCDSLFEEKSPLTDVIFILLSATTCFASFCNLDNAPGSSRDIVDMGKNFHRLYSDCSDDSEEENGDSEELESNPVMMSRESPLKYPLRKFMANFHPASVSPKQQSPESLNETFRTANSSFGRSFAADGRVSRNSLYSPRSSPRSPHRFGECTLKPAGSQGNLSLLNDTFYSFENRSQFSDLNSTLCDFRSVQALPTEEFNSAIGKLRIDDANGVRMSNASENLWQRTSPLAQHRANNVVLAHARVSPNSAQHSWVAGGFWSGSPVKKSLIRSHILNTAPLEELEQIESRSSSLSSGFESRPSSVHDNIGTHSNSRESSVSGDPEVTSAFSEPLPQRNFNYNGKFLPGKKSDRPLPVFPIINSTTQTFIHPSKFDKN